MSSRDYSGLTPREQVRIAEDPATTAEQLLELAHAARHSAVHEAVAAHPACPVEALDHIARTGSAWACERVAAHPNTSRDTLKRIAYAEDDDAATLADAIAAAVQNPRLTSSDIRRIWEHHHQEETLYQEIEVGMVERGDPEVLGWLWDSENEYVREQVALSDSTPVEALVSLAADQGSAAGEIVKRRAEETRHPALLLAARLSDLYTARPEELVEAVKAILEEEDYSRPISR